MSTQPCGNNMAAVRARAELFADRMNLHSLTPLQAGYVAVSLSMAEAARQLREAANNRLSPRQTLTLAEVLDGIADDALLLGQAETDERDTDDA